MFTGEREFGKTTNSQFLASRETHRPLVAAMETPEISFHVYAFVADVLETLPSACDTLKSRKTTPFPAGRSLVSGAFTSGGASSGKPNLVFYLNLSFLLSHNSSSSFRPHRAPTSNLSHHSISASPVSQGYLHCPFSTTLIIGTFFLKQGPSWLIRRIDLFIYRAALIY